MSQNTLKHNVISGLFWQFSEKFLAQLVTFVVTIILARLLEPSDYGIIAILLVFVTFANILMLTCTQSSLIQGKDVNDEDFSTIFYFNLFSSVVLYICIYVGAPYIARFFDNELFVLLLRVLSFEIIISAINSVQRAYVAKNMMFYRFFWSTLVGTIISAIVGIMMAYCGYGVWALVFQHLSNVMIDSIVLFFTIDWKPTLQFNFEKLKLLLSFGWKVSMDNVLNNIYSSGRSILIGKIYNSAVLGEYSKGLHLPELLINNVNSTISSVMFPAFCKVQDDSATMKRLISRSIRSSSFFLSPLLIGVCVVAPDVVSLLFTDKWLGCVPYIRIASIYYLFFPLTCLTLDALLAVGKSDIVLKMTFIKRVASILLLICAIKYGIILVALVDLVIVLMAVLLNGYPCKYFFGYSIFGQLKDFIPGFLLSCFMGVGVFLLGNIMVDCSLVYKLILQISLGALLYLLLTFLFVRKDLVYMWNTVKNIFCRTFRGEGVNM